MKMMINSFIATSFFLVAINSMADNGLVGVAVKSDDLTSDQSKKSDKEKRRTRMNLAPVPQNDFHIRNEKPKSSSESNSASSNSKEVK